MDRRITPRLLAVSLTIGSGMAVFPVMAGNDSWTVAGSPPGGNVVTVTVDPVTPSTLYAVSGPGIFQSTDSGAHWSLTLPLPDNNASDIAIEPENHTTVYVATQGDGIFRSTDGGATWTGVNTGIGLIENNSEEDSVYRVTVDPVTDGTAYAITLNTGVFKTTDHGAHWSAINSGIGSLPGNLNVLMNRLLVDPVNPQVLYLAVTEYTSPTNSSTALAGLYTSINGGSTWTRTVIAGQDVSDIDIDPSDDTHLIALAAGGIVSVTNSGANTASLSSTPGYPTAVRFDPSNDQHIFVSNGWSGLYQSTDGGTTWSLATGTQGVDVDAIAVDPVTPTNVYASTYSWGVFNSADGGSTWNPSSIGIYNVVPNLMFEGSDEVTYLATGGSGIYKSPDQGVTWTEVGGGVTGSLPEIGDFVYGLAEDPTAPGTLYAGTTGGLFKTLDGGDTWTEIDSGLYKYFTTVAIDPENTATVYVGSSYGNGPYKSTDGGATWQTIATGIPMTANDPESGVWALTVDPKNSDVVYAGSFASGLFKSTDAGAHWTASNSGMSVNSVWAIAVDPTNDQVVYAATAGGFFKSTDAGADWTESDSGLNGYIMTYIQIDPANTSTLYVTPMYGIGDAYVSTDGGATWNALSDGLSASAARTKGLRRTASMVMPGGHRVTRSVGGPVTINAVAIDPKHHTRLLGAGSDGQIYAYNDLNPPTGSGSGGTPGGGSSGSSSSGGGDFSLLLILGLAGFAARRKR